MTAPLRPDDINRAALLAAHEGSQPTLEVVSPRTAGQA
jgi:hypothetical protein